MRQTSKSSKSNSLKAAVTISARIQTSDAEITERLARRGWGLRGRTNSVKRALREIETGKAAVLIIEDSQDLPVQYVLRQLMSSRIGILSPKLVLAGQKNAPEMSCFGTMASPMVIEAPTTPLNFVESFQFLVEKWSRGYLNPLLQTRGKILSGKHQDAIKILSNLTRSEDPQITTLAGLCLSLYFRQQNLRTSEKVLLNLLEKSKKNMGIIFSLADLYYLSAMPGYAKRLLSNAAAIYGKPKTILLDQFHCYSLLNDIPKMIAILQRMLNEKYMPQIANKYLPRLLLAEGKMDEFENHTRSHDELASQHLLAWGHSQSERASQCQQLKSKPKMKMTLENGFGRNTKNQKTTFKHQIYASSSTRLKNVFH